MSQSSSYAQVLMALLAMLLLLVFPLVYDDKSFRFLMALRVLGWGIVVILFLVWLSPFFRE